MAVKTAHKIHPSEILDNINVNLVHMVKDLANNWVTVHKFPKISDNKLQLI